MATSSSMTRRQHGHYGDAAVAFLKLSSCIVKMSSSISASVASGSSMASTHIRKLHLRFAINRWVTLTVYRKCKCTITIDAMHRKTHFLKSCVVIAKASAHWQMGQHIFLM
jgi:hypothetical protein